MTTSPDTVSTRQAAKLLNVTHPYLISLLDQGVIPSQGVDNERVILVHDLEEYKNRGRQASATAADELTRQAQQLDMGY